MFLLALAACGGGEVAAPIREAKEFRFVGPETMNVYKSPDASSPVIVTYERGESVSIFEVRGEWAEVRVAEGSGWAKTSDLVTTQQQEKLEADNLTPRFIVQPSPVTDLGTRGEIVIEANVNTSGEVIDVKVIRNTTGSPGLAYKNAEALRSAKFAPIVRNGKREKFIYEHRVSY
jgi:uncharacterized protein YgiM (DUF1202 family)